MERRFSWLLRNKWKYILGEWGGSRFFMIKWVGGGCVKVFFGGWGRLDIFYGRLEVNNSEWRYILD